MAKCNYRNSYTRCKAGWIYEPDGYGCVQSALCPVCDGEGVVPCQKILSESKTNLTAGTVQQRTANASNADGISSPGASRTASVRTAKRPTVSPAVPSLANTE